MVAFGNSLLGCRRGQAAVEMAVVMPVLLAVVGIAINLMLYLGDCARFDRAAAEAIRTQAASPGYGRYDSSTRAQDVQTIIEECFKGSDNLSFSVSVSESSVTAIKSGEGMSFSLFPHHETFVCRMEYRPWGFGNSFFGVSFGGIPHTRVFVIDPYRPGAVL